MTPAWPAMMWALAALAAVAGQSSIASATEGSNSAAAPRPAVRAEIQADLVRTGQDGAEDETSNAPALSLTAVHDWMVASYERAPALLFGLAALLAVPPLVMTGLVLKRRDALAGAGDAGDAGDMTQMQTRVVAKTQSKLERRQPATEGAPRWPTQAWIEVEGADNGRHGLGRAIVRIGREGDNDICLSEMTVHRYHAAVHRTDDADFVITDLSSAGGNGIKVNGKPVAEVRLEDGDLIELGLARLKFVAEPT